MTGTPTSGTRPVSASRVSIPGAGYTDRAGITSRANSALIRISLVLEDTGTDPAVRLALIAEIMSGEPILTDTGSPAAHAVRAEASRPVYAERFGIVRARS